MEDRSSIKNRIREHRFHNGEMTQEELAQRVGVTARRSSPWRPGNTFRPCCWPSSLLTPSA